MEPLPKERSDGRQLAAPPAGRRASMEPLPKERSDRAVAEAEAFRSARLNGAAPEGAERRLPADAAVPRCTRPQWSRSRRSGATPGRRRSSARTSAASMEPLPKERSDAADCRSRHATRAPQWSRSRRSGATAWTRRMSSRADRASMEPLPKERSDLLAGYGCYRATASLNGAAPEGAERRRGSRTRPPGRWRLNGAAPEGAERRLLTRTEDEADHACLNGAAPEGAERRLMPERGRGGLDEPQWSRSRRSGATLERDRDKPVVVVASMEPLPKERSDANTQTALPRFKAPQWSRSRRSGATIRSNDLRAAVTVPQWSRSRRSGATSRLSVRPVRAWPGPQWSRSRRSGATTSPGRSPCRAHRPQWSRSRRSGATGDVPVVSTAELPASMEPLPKERSDT